MRQSLQNIQKNLIPTFRRHNIIKAIIFGSMARGDDSPKSDLDLILVQDTEKRFFDRYDSILYELSCAVDGRDVEVLIYTPQELIAINQRSFIKTALQEGIIIYESN